MKHFETMELASGRLLILRVTGKLTKEDYECFVPTFDRLIETHGSIHLLVDMHDFHGWETSALWEDLKLGVRHFTDIGRVAMVGEATWQSWMAGFCNVFTSARIRYFPREEAEEALAWVGERLSDDLDPGAKLRQTDGGDFGSE